MLFIYHLYKKKNNLISKEHIPGNGTNPEARVRDVILEKENKWTSWNISGVVFFLC